MAAPGCPAYGPTGSVTVIPELDVEPLGTVIVKA